MLRYLGVVNANASSASNDAHIFDNFAPILFSTFNPIRNCRLSQSAAVLLLFAPGEDASGTIGTPSDFYGMNVNNLKHDEDSAREYVVRVLQQSSGAAWA
jgi:hypothetical protein